MKQLTKQLRQRLDPADLRNIAVNPLGESRIEIDEPLCFRKVFDADIGEGGTDFGNGRRIVDRDMHRWPRECSGEHRREGCRRVESGGRIERCGAVQDDAPTRLFGDKLGRYFTRSSRRLQPEPFRNARGLSTLSFAADLHDDALPLAERPAAWLGFSPGQKSRPLIAEIHERRAERREQPEHAAEINAAGLSAITMLDIELDGDTRFEQRCAPLPGTRSD